MESIPVTLGEHRSIARLRDRMHHRLYFSVDTGLSKNLSETHYNAEVRIVAVVTATPVISHSRKRPQGEQP